MTTFEFWNIGGQVQLLTLVYSINGGRVTRNNCWLDRCRKASGQILKAANIYRQYGNAQAWCLCLGQNERFSRLASYGKSQYSSFWSRRRGLAGRGPACYSVITCLIPALRLATTCSSEVQFTCVCIQVLSQSDVAPGTECPAGKQPVLFFGTQETALMKPVDLCSYEQYRSKFEVIELSSCR